MTTATAREEAPKSADLRSLDDGSLAYRAALSNDRAAWAEMLRRFEPVIRHQLGRSLSAAHSLLSSDSLDDAMQEFWLAVLKKDRAWLLRFEPERGHKLASWLGLMAWDVGSKHVRKLRRLAKGLPDLEAPEEDMSPEEQAIAIELYLERKANRKAARARR
jgi:RNA polymerase sigma-70 factor (ECF subfamily)